MHPFGYSGLGLDYPRAPNTPIMGGHPTRLSPGGDGLPILLGDFVRYLAFVPKNPIFLCTIYRPVRCLTQCTSYRVRRDRN
jgi:hypothetical protein